MPLPTYHQQKAAHLRALADTYEERFGYVKTAGTLREWAEWHDQEAERLKTSETDKPK